MSVTNLLLSLTHLKSNKSMTSRNQAGKFPSYKRETPAKVSYLLSWLGSRHVS